MKVVKNINYQKYNNKFVTDELFFYPLLQYPDI